MMPQVLETQTDAQGMIRKWERVSRRPIGSGGGSETSDCGIWRWRV